MESIRSINEHGTIRYTNENGDLHRLNGPAYESTSGYKAWYVNGRLHREDGPAKIWGDGHLQYYIDGMYYYSKEQWELKISKIKLNRIKDL